MKKVYIGTSHQNEVNKLRGLKRGTVVYMHPRVYNSFNFWRFKEQIDLHGLELVVATREEFFRIYGGDFGA